MPPYMVGIAPIYGYYCNTGFILGFTGKNLVNPVILSKGLFNR
jgi:hypothetical protein